MNNKKGFLFTISAIFFASTLVFFAQGFYESNLSMEKKIISSSLPVNLVYLNEDIAFDLKDILGVSFDINSAEKSVAIDGVMSSSSSVNGALDSYASFVDTVFFPRSVFSKSLDLSKLTDGKAEFYLGNRLKADYNYGNSVALYSSPTCPLKYIDLNIQTSGTMVSYEWVKSDQGTTIPVSISYADDSNSLIFTDYVGRDFASYLKFVYSDGNTFVRFGRMNYLGADYNSMFEIESKQDQEIIYTLKAGYSDCNLYPLRLNSVLSVSSAGIDSNTALSLFK